MAEIVKGALVIIDANLPDFKVFWKGKEVLVDSLIIKNNKEKTDVTMIINENEAYAEMKEAGITIKTNKRGKK